MHLTRVNKKNTFLFVTSISVGFHNLLQCMWIKHITKKSLQTQLKTN